MRNLVTIAVDSGNAEKCSTSSARASQLPRNRAPKAASGRQQPASPAKAILGQFSPSAEIASGSALTVTGGNQVAPASSLRRAACSPSHRPRRVFLRAKGRWGAEFGARHSLHSRHSTGGSAALATARSQRPRAVAQTILRGRPRAPVVKSGPRHDRCAADRSGRRKCFSLVRLSLPIAADTCLAMVVAELGVDGQELAVAAVGIGQSVRGLSGCCTGGRCARASKTRPIARRSDGRRSASPPVREANHAFADGVGLRWFSSARRFT